MSSPEKSWWTQSNPDEIHEHLLSKGVEILAMVWLIFGFTLACCLLVLIYSQKFYDIVSNGQDSLCNFYTCANSDECDGFPKIIFPDGEEKCLTN